jgi:hypothetical protein
VPLIKQGWAFVSASESGGTGDATGQGPVGSVQYHTGSGGISGSAELLYLTSSSNLILTGNLLVNGDIIATNLDIVNHTVSYLSSSGDSKFGDTSEDLHEFTGSVEVWRSGSSVPILLVTASSDERVGILCDHPVASFTLSGSYAINYSASSDSTISISSTTYFLAVTTAAAVTVQLPTATGAGRGRVLVVKATTAGPNVTVSASTGQTIDGDAYQELLSDHASETYVSDGTAAWYII